MLEKLIIVSGVYGTGKTTYAGTFKYPVLHMDDYVSPPSEDIHYSDIKIILDKYSDRATIIFDAYYFVFDKDLSGLKSIISPTTDIEILMVYTTINELLMSRIISNKKGGHQTVEEELHHIKHGQNKLINIFTDYMEKGRVSSVQYLFRENDKYIFRNKEHILKIIGGIQCMNSEELIKFAEGFEPGGNYQTIEVNGKVIRPGGERCWKSWENICKFNIDWSKKFVCDIGCYFGYFSTKILRAGVRSVFGIDQNETVLPVYENVLLANGFQNFQTQLLKLGDGNIVPNHNYDLLLALNMLHHVRRNTTELEYIRVLNSIFISTKEVIFEVNNDQISQIKKIALENEFILKNTAKSHRWQEQELYYILGGIMVKQTIILAGVDGYIGNALAQRLLFKGHRVIGIDNMLRRRWVRDYMKSFSAIDLYNMEEKETLFKKLGNFEFHAFDIVENVKWLRDIIEKEHPDTFVNLAHIPSGPFSQISFETADLTLKNNYISTNNILWAIRELCPDTHYITIGTTGEYDHYSNIDIEEGYIKINHNGRESNELIYPRRPGSIYHSSKTASTYLIDFLSRTWGLKCTDIQQSVVFGSYTDEIKETGIYSRLDSDEAAGTVINRFIVQAVLGVPLTVYGKGKHQRGFLSLNDSVQAMEIAIKNQAAPGKTQVWNQLSEWHSINDLAAMVKNVCPNVEISHIPTPRNEHTGDHYYKYITKKLAKLGYKSTRQIEEEIMYVYKLVKDNEKKIQPLKNVVMPKITWR